MYVPLMSIVARAKESVTKESEGGEEGGGDSGFPNNIDYMDDESVTRRGGTEWEPTGSRRILRVESQTNISIQSTHLTVC